MPLLNQGYSSFAALIKGRRIKTTSSEIEIVEAVGYSRKDNSSPLYESILDVPAGTVYCPRYRGGILVLIACHDTGRPGGCVLLRKAKANGRIISGPGHVAEALGITIQKTKGYIVEDGEVLVLTLKP